MEGVMNIKKLQVASFKLQELIALILSEHQLAMGTIQMVEREGK